MSEYFNEDQIFGAVLFFVGIALLTWLTRTERRQMAKMRDPKLKWAYIDSDGKKRDEVRKRGIRSIIVTLVGGAMAFYGFLSFLNNVK